MARMIKTALSNLSKLNYNYLISHSLKKRISFHFSYFYITKENLVVFDGSLIQQLYALDLVLFTILSKPIQLCLLVFILLKVAILRT
jgi:hypothetical protein